MLGPVLARAGEPWIDWDWVGRHLDDIEAATREHIELTVLAVGIGLVVSFPLGLLSARWRRWYAPVMWFSGLLYTIPSLALFVFFIPITGLSRTSALIGLVIYTLLILIRNLVAGLDAVPPDIKDAATGMGYGGAARLLRVELPLALPTIIAGVRIATVTTIGLVTITAYIGQGGLGQLIRQGLEQDFTSPLYIGSILSVALAVVADLLLLLVQRLATPWARARAA